jgi:hypothetical protein
VIWKNGITTLFITLVGMAIIFGVAYAVDWILH